jgi:hypothetical protein
MKREGYIFARIVCPLNIRRAIRLSSKNKRGKRIIRRVLNNQTAAIKRISKLLMNGFKPSPYQTATVFDGASKKERVIKKPKYFPDQIVHWALIMQIEHLMMRGMYDWSCGSIPGRGQARCKQGVERWLRNDPANTKYCLKLDIKKFYQNVDNDLLKVMFRRIVKCPQTLALIDSIIDSTQGLNIGNYTSQWFANFYLQGVDHYIKEKLRYFKRRTRSVVKKVDAVVYYARYVDDMVLFGKNKKYLHKAREMLFSFLRNELRLEIKDNWQVFLVATERVDRETGKIRRVGRDVDFLGFRMNHKYTTVRRRLSLRIARRARKIAKKLKPSSNDCAAMVAYHGFIRHSDSYNYYRNRIKPYVNINKMKGLIGSETRAKRKRAADGARGNDDRRSNGANNDDRPGYDHSGYGH